MKPKSKKSEKILEDRQAIVSEAIGAAHALVDALIEAEVCETTDDFAANLQEAGMRLVEISATLQEAKEAGR